MPISIPLREVELHFRGAPPRQHIKERYEGFFLFFFKLSLLLLKEDRKRLMTSPSHPPDTRAPPGFKETAFLYAISSAGLTHALAKACSAGRMERCTCDEAPDLENRKAWQWGGCGDNLKYANKFVKDFLGKRSNKDLRARVDMHNTNVGMKVGVLGVLLSPGGYFQLECDSIAKDLMTKGFNSERTPVLEDILVLIRKLK